MTKEIILSECEIEGNIVRIPSTYDKLDRKLYVEIAKTIELIGGKWKGGKVKGFVFPFDPTELMEQISNGTKRNLKKEYQFFGTPDSLADQLVSLAELEEHHTILEPSAGQGAIVKAIHRMYPNMSVDCFELMDINRIFLRKLDNIKLVGNDFLTEPKNQYDRIIANPPFSKNQDVDHIKMMYKSLKDGGILVSVASRHWYNCTGLKELEFSEWLFARNAKTLPLEEGTFKESGTNVAAFIIIIRK